MSLGSILDQFAGGTTLHGIPKAIRSKTKTGRIFWVLACVLALCICSLQFVQLLTKYYSYPKKVTIDVVSSNVPFPCISLCNMRNLDIMVLNKLNKFFKSKVTENVTTLTWDAHDLNDSFIEEYMSYLSKYYPLQKDYDLLLQAVLTRSTIATNIDRKLVSQAGIPFDEFIVTCRFGSLDCNRSSEFDHFFDPFYYNCFTYHGISDDQSEHMLAEGLENGWSTVVLTGSGMLDQNEEIRIIPGTHERLSPQSSNEGVRVVIHPPNTEPFPHTEGFDVPPGHSVSFGLKPVETKRIGPPHGNCTDLEGYRLIKCQRLCLQRGVIQKCGCKDIHLPGHQDHPDVRFCSDDSDLVASSCSTGENAKECAKGLQLFYERLTCARNAVLNMAKNGSYAKACGCSPPCYELNYEVTYSLSKWPAESFDGEEAYIDIFDVEDYPSRIQMLNNREKYEKYSIYFNQSNRRESMKDFARLNVYIADSNVLKTVETEDYQQSQLLSDIGGQLGLWVGISVITLAEILELCLNVFQYLIKRHRRPKQSHDYTAAPSDEPVIKRDINTKIPSRNYYTCHCRYLKNGNIHLFPMVDQTILDTTV